MGVNSKIFGMVGVNIPFSDASELMIMNNLGISREQLIKDYSNSLYDYFESKGLSADMWHDSNKDTYRIIFDGMSGKYIRAGFIIFENEEANPVNIPYLEVHGINYDAIKKMIKVLFGIDGVEIRLFVFTHYS